MGRINRGFRLAGISWAVLRADPELLLLPLLSLVSIAAAAVIVFAVGRGAGVELTLSTRDASAGQWALLAVVYFLSSLGTIFFNSALIGAAAVRLDGGDPSLADALRIALSRLHVIIAWAIVSSTIGLAIRALQDRVPFVGNIVAWVFGTAWSVATFFVVPILVFERRSIPATLRRSTDLVVEAWGEGLVGSGLIFGALFVAFFPLFVTAGIVVVISIPLAVLLLVLAILVLTAVSSALSAIFETALYRYAAAGDVYPLWNGDDMRAAFRPRRRRDRTD